MRWSRAAALSAAVVGTIAALWPWARPETSAPPGRVKSSSAVLARSRTGSGAQGAPVLAPGAGRDGGAGEAAEAEVEAADEPAVRLRVRVEHDGEPVAHAQVVVMEYAPVPEWDDTVTGADGEVDLEVTRGAAVVHARLGAMTGQVAAMLDGPTNVAVVRVDEQAAIEGRVTNEAGAAVVGARVSGAGSTTATDLEGRYALDVPAAIGQVSVTKEGYLDVVRGFAPRARERVRLDFVLQRAVTFEVEATCEGKKLGAAFMTLSHLDGGHAQYSLLERDHYLAAPGDYLVEVHGPSNGHGCKGQGPLTIAAGVKKVLELTPTEEAWADSAPPDLSKRTASLRLTSRPVVRPTFRPGESYPRIVLTGPGSPQQSGELPMTVSLEPGRWHVRAVTPVGLAEADVEVSAGRQTEFELELVPAGYRISGRLVDPRAGGPPNALNAVFVEATYLDDPQTLTVSADLSTDGTFVFRQLPPGRLVVAVQADGFARMLKPIQLTGNVELGTLKLQPGKTGAVDLAALGVATSPTSTGLRVDHVERDVGLQAGDVIVAYAGIALSGLSAEDARAASSGLVGEPCPALTERRGTRFTAELPRTE